MSTYANLPAPSPEQGLNRYMQEIRKFPLLEPEEEYMLAKAWAERQDPQAAHRLVTSHLRLAAKIAMGYRGYGLPQAEVISEANVGLMQAVKRFDPERGEMTKDGRQVKLTGAETALLRILSASAGKPISRLELAQRTGAGLERSIDVQVTRLRRKIEADPKMPLYLQTVRSIGYVLVPDGVA